MYFGLHGYKKVVWVPVFAGMTVVGSKRLRGGSFSDVFGIIGLLPDHFVQRIKREMDSIHSLLHVIPVYTIL